MPVQARLHAQTAASARYLVMRHQTGAKSAGAVEILAHRPLRSLHLVVADRRIIEYRIADDMRQGILLGYAPAGAADHRNEFNFVVELSGFARAQQRGAMTDQGGIESDEYARISRPRKSAFGGMRRIIEPDADDFWGRHQRRKPLDRGRVELPGER